jgi:hypothetical protein
MSGFHSALMKVLQILCGTENTPAVLKSPEASVFAARVFKPISNEQFT